MAFVIPVIGAILNSVAAGGAAVAAGAGEAAGAAVNGVAGAVLPTVAGGGIATPASANISGLTGTAAAGGSVSAGAAPVATAPTAGLAPTATAAADTTIAPTVATPVGPVPELPGQGAEAAFRAGTSSLNSNLATVAKVGLPVLGVASGGVQAGLSVYQGNKRAQAVREQARVAAGADELNVGKANQQALALASEISSTAASSGIDTSGSPLILTLDTLGKAREDAQQSRANSMARIRQAGREASAYETAGIIGGIGAGLGGALSGLAAGVKVA